MIKKQTTLVLENPLIALKEMLFQAAEFPEMINPLTAKMLETFNSQNQNLGLRASKLNFK